MINIESIAKMKNNYEEFLTIYRKEEHDVVLYGAGKGADWAIRLLGKDEVPIAKIVDQNVKGEKLGIQITSLEQIRKEYTNKKVYFIVTTPRHEKEAIDSLKKYWAEDSIFSFECELYYSYIHNIPEYREYLVNNEAKFNTLHEKLADDLSRKTLECALKGRVSAEICYFQEIYRENQYFPNDLFEFRDDDVFCDIGAYIGDTVEKVVELNKGKYKKIYCFEPDETCFEMLKANTQRLKFEKVQLIKKGAWNKEEKLYLNEDAEHGASCIGEEGKSIIELDCIDKLVNKEDKVTHIKMDIEGAELNALKGATETIKRNTPFLGICVYHKNEDFLEISKYILSLVPEYKLYLRHHNISGTETVLYAML